jgi:hypothetical protein
MRWFAWLALVMIVAGCAGGLVQQLAQPSNAFEPSPSEQRECAQLAQDRGLTVAQFAGRMVVLNMVRNLWAVHLFSLVGTRCGCTLVRCA